MHQRVKLISTFISLSFLVGCSGQVNSTFGSLDQTQANILSKKNSGDQIADYISKIARESDELQKVPAQPILGKQVKSLSSTKNSKDLTYFTYEALDSNLYQDLNRIVDTLELVGTDENINLVAQTDSWKEGNTARYIISKDSDFGTINSEYEKLSSKYENSGDPNVFANSVKWAFSSFPAKTKWLNMSTHGYGFAGIAFDDNPQGSMNIVEFTKALKSGLGRNKLDILSFDACLMATVEVASELQGVSDILIGSEDSTFYWGYGYYNTFSKISRNPSMNPDSITRSLVLDVNNKGKANQTLTISATNINKISLLEEQIDKLSRALRRALPEHRDEIFRALSKSKAFAMAEDVPFRDINRVVKLLKDNVNDNEIKEICNKINDILYRKGVIMLSRQSRHEDDQGRGLSIYVPLNGKVSQSYRTTRFAKSTQWDEFLLELNSAIN